MTPSLFPELFVDARMERLQALLTAAYGRPAPRVLWDPLRQLVYSILSPRTKTEVSDAVQDGIEAYFGVWDGVEGGPGGRDGSAPGDWTGVRDAPVAEVEEVIAAVTFPDVKAVRLQQVLRRITAENGGRLSLDFLAGQPTERLRAWLETLEGVGAKASAAVANFSTLRRRAMAIDAHHQRIAIRLGLVPRGAGTAETERRLMERAPESWTAETLDEHHSLMKVHGQRRCTALDWSRQCGRCPLLEMCPTGQAKVG